MTKPFDFAVSTLRSASIGLGLAEKFSHRGNRAWLLVRKDDGLHKVRLTMAEGHVVVEAGEPWEA